MCVCVCVCVCARARARAILHWHSKNKKAKAPAKMGSIKDRNGIDLTEAEDIKKRWQEYTEKLYKKDLHIPGCLALGE